MALLETNGDYMFAENVEELSRSVSKLNEALDEQLEINQNLMNSVRQLTEVIEFQSLIQTVSLNKQNDPNSSHRIVELGNTIMR